MDILYLVITTIAIIVGPTIAVQIQIYLDKKREMRKRKLEVFKNLMATRAMGLSPEHVRALNMIDIEFYDQKQIIDSWREYHSHLGEPFDENSIALWSQKKNELLINLLFVMGKHLDYDFDKVNLKTGSYIPLGYGKIDEQNLLIRDNIIQILTGKKPFLTAQVPADNETKAKGEEIIRLITELISGKSILAVKLTKDDQ